MLSRGLFLILILLLILIRTGLPRRGCEFSGRPEQATRSSGTRRVRSRPNCRNCAALVPAYVPSAYTESRLSFRRIT
jgi:hypothetical protein